MDRTKLSFFSRVKKAIFKFEDYEKFIEEKLGVAIAYFEKLIFVFSIFITVAICIIINTNIQRFVNVFNLEFPNFEISQGKLQIEEQAKYEKYFEDLDIYVIMNKNEDNIINTDYKNNIQVLKNKMVIKYLGITQEFSYNYEHFSKQNVLEYFESGNLFKMLAIIGFFILIATFVTYSIIFWTNIFMLTILGLIINVVIKTSFKFIYIFKIAIYAMTLPVLLELLYILANLFMGITIKYFQIAYNAISYIYLITVLLMMKSDIIKNMQELQKILDEEKKIREELKRQRQEEEEKQREGNQTPKEGKKEKEKNKDKPKGEPQVEN